MTPHPLVAQLRFARSEFARGLDGLSDAAAVRRVGPANPISWTVGHLAWQEQRYWLQRLSGVTVAPELDRDFCFGCETTTPDPTEIWTTWRSVIEASDPVLDTLSTNDLVAEPVVDGEPLGTTTGSMLLRNIYHYWFHLGEAMGLRQAMGHSDLAQFVGAIDTEAPYRAEA
jgi:hypothetical protein